MSETDKLEQNVVNKLSIVIITRNEAKNIARAIESVFVATKKFPGTEILLVDSASTDDTVNIARQYPINILRLKSNWFLSVPAGRHIGMQYTRGDLVLHMDGDMELDPDWINQSVGLMVQNTQVGAVGGYYRNIYMKNNLVVREQDIHKGPSNQIKEVRYVGGAALYRRAAIEAMGGFQPYIRGEEGVYVSMGIRNSGYKVVQMPILMSRHYCVDPHSLAYSQRRLQKDMWLGFGQVPRYYWGTGLFWTYLRERGSYVIYLAGLVVSILTLFISLLTKNYTYFAIWSLIVTLFIAVFVVKKRSISKTLISLVAHTGIAISAVRGFLIAPRSSAEYPLDAEIIQVYHA